MPNWRCSSQQWHLNTWTLWPSQKFSLFSCPACQILTFCHNPLCPILTRKVPFGVRKRCSRVQRTSNIKLSTTCATIGYLEGLNVTGARQKRLKTLNFPVLVDDELCEGPKQTTFSQRVYWKNSSDIIVGWWPAVTSRAFFFKSYIFTNLFYLSLSSLPSRFHSVRLAPDLEATGLPRNSAKLAQVTEKASCADSLRQMTC